VHQDERDLAVVAPDQLRADAHQQEPSVWDAWDGVRRDAMADALREVHQHRDADA